MRLAISSPGRGEKFPPPLMRFLRTNVGSRSRGRSRTSPMFVFRKKTTAIEIQEPSSPKVTCMGQVRVRRSKQSGTKSTRPSRTQTPGRRHCGWIRNSLSCLLFKKFETPRSLRTVWRKWVLFFHVDFTGRRSKTGEDSPKYESKFENKSEDLEQEDEEEEEYELGDIERASRVHASTSISSPPKNAFLLTRSRSAPYRSSSLASRFWSSETEQQKQEQQDENREDENPTSNTESISEDSGPKSSTDPEMDTKIITFIDVDVSESESIRERFSSDARIEEVKTMEEVDTARRSILTRCKSEPARIAAALYPELSFWRKRWLGFT